MTEPVRCDVLMDDGSWQPDGRIVERDGGRALIAFQELIWWAEADEWRTAREETR